MTETETCLLIDAVRQLLVAGFSLSFGGRVFIRPTGFDTIELVVCQTEAEWETVRKEEFDKDKGLGTAARVFVEITVAARGTHGGAISARRASS